MTGRRGDAPSPQTTMRHLPTLRSLRPSRRLVAVMSTTSTWWKQSIDQRFESDSRRTASRLPCTIRGQSINRTPTSDSVRVGTLRVSERLAAEVVSLPIYPELTDAEVDAVSEALRRNAGESLTVSGRSR